MKDEMISHVRPADMEVQTNEEHSLGVAELAKGFATEFGMGDEFLAHSANADGKEQTMKEHSCGVASMMSDMALSDAFTDMYVFCGLLHDLGKYSDAFKRKIKGEDLSVQHSKYGAMFVAENNLYELAIPIYGHHAGLPNEPEMRQNLLALQQNAKDYDLYKEICARWKGDNIISDVPNNIASQNIRSCLERELFIRMLYSALVDADSLDTERHFAKQRFLTRRHIPFDAESLRAKLQKKLDSFKQDTNLNKLRYDVLNFAASKADMPQGFYSMTLPTGMGKTLCSMNWALNHAIKHKNVNRIIVVLPFISIIDQTSEIFKDIFNDDNEDYILEHHSNVIYDSSKDEMPSPKQFATENWDYPIIITTAVQFFESLFSNKRSACRKLHNIQDSIIIFDEIQTLPLELTEPTLKMLDNLQQLCRCSILFCTATQPDFSRRDGFGGISHIESLVQNPQYIFEETKRVEYHAINNYEDIELSELVDFVLNKDDSALVVFNTKKKAYSFYEMIKDTPEFKVFHLSTTICPIHRKKVIANIRATLKKGEKIIVSSTQLIEAGVDMDFPTVYREVAPLASIIQSAGRCNREGERKNSSGEKIMGDVFLFMLSDDSQPGQQYKTLSKVANLMYKGNENKLNTHDFYAEYYQYITNDYVNTDEFAITADRKKYKYQDVSDKYKLIKSETHTLFIYNYDDGTDNCCSKSRDLYLRLKEEEFLTKFDLQEVSQYSVQVFKNFLERNKGFYAEEENGLLVWFGSYSKETGLPFEEEITPIII